MREMKRVWHAEYIVEISPRTSITAEIRAKHRLLNIRMHVYCGI